MTSSSSSSSWFTTFSNTLQQTSKLIQDDISNLHSTVRSTLGPTSSNAAQDLFTRLTLSTPELNAQREQIDVEERRKEAVRNALASLLPWETIDEERAVLVEECKESIFRLSTDEMVFKESCPLRELENAILRMLKMEGDLPGSQSHDEKKFRLGGAAAGRGDLHEKANLDMINSGGTQIDYDTTNVVKCNNSSDDNKKEQIPSVSLSSSSVVPILLSNFDLHAHVGLIGRVLEADPNLVKMHSELSGGKVKEVNFWKHYFVHCALCRVKIGLDLDEIWGCNVYLPTEDEIKKNTSSTPKTFTIMKTTTAKGDNVNDVGGGMTHSDSDEENEITFDSLCVEDNESEKDRTRGKRGDEADATVVQEGVDESNRSRASSSTSLSHQIAAAAASAAGTVAAASYIPFGSSSGERSRQGCCEDGASSSASSPPSDYEFVSSPTASENADIDDTLAGSSSPLSETAAGGRGGADAFDDNIVLEDDDLDAEIARELES